MPLILTKLEYGRSPWRIVLRYTDGRTFPATGRTEAELPDCGFLRKKDALPFLERFLTIGDWDQFDTFTVDQLALVRGMLEETPMAWEKRALMTRGVVAPG